MKVQNRILNGLLSLLLIVASTTLVAVPQAEGSNKPTPKASLSAKKETKKESTKKKVTKKKSVKKKSVKKKSVKKKPRKISKPIPSPAPKWPPKGFQEVDGVYISTPKSEKELVGVLSAKTTLLSEIRACEKYVCAVIYVASETQCKWWQVQAIIIGRSADVLGNLQTLAKGTKPRERRTIILISKEPVKEYAEILNMKAFCRNDEMIGKVPSNTFTPNPALMPLPSPSPSPSASPSAVTTPEPNAASPTPTSTNGAIGSA